MVIPQPMPSCADTTHVGAAFRTLMWQGETAGLAYNTATGSTHLLAAEAMVVLQAGISPDWQQRWRAALDAIGIDAADNELRQWRDQLAAVGLIDP